MVETDFLEAIHVPLKMLKFFGCFWTNPVPSSKDNECNGSSTIRSILVCIYRFLFVLLHLANITKSLCFEVYAIMHWDSSMAFFAQFHFIMFFCSAIYFVELVTTKYYARPVFQAFMKYNLDYKFRGNLHRFKKIVNFISYLLVALAFFSQVLIGSAYLIWMKKDMHFVFYPYTPRGDDRDIVVGVAICLTSFLTIWVNGGFLLLYTALVELARMELKTTKDEISEVVRPDNEISKLQDIFFKVRDRHRYLVDVVNKVSQLVRCYGAMGIANTMAVVMFVLYVLGNGQCQVEEIITELIVLLSMPFVVVMLCWKWGALPALAHSVIDAIKSVQLNEASTQLLHQIQLFQTEVLMSKTGIDLFGLFTFDSSTILMIFGTVLTYGILVFQTGQGTGSDCHCICNTTCV